MNAIQLFFVNVLGARLDPIPVIAAAIIGLTLRTWQSRLLAAVGSGPVLFPVLSTMIFMTEIGHKNPVREAGQTSFFAALAIALMATLVAWLRSKFAEGEEGNRGG